MLLETPICDFGWQMPDAKLPDAHGKMHKLKSHMGEKGLLIMFICNHCPYVKAIIDRLVADVKKLQENGIGVVAIMSNDYQQYPEDSPENMILFAEQHGMTFPYLVDQTQHVTKTYNAICTPDFFGFNNKGALQYRGRLDDAARGDATNRQAELLDAMHLIATTGQGPEQQTPSMGCSIKWR